MVLEDCSTGSFDVEMVVLRDQDTLIISTQPVDSVYINNIDFVRVCLTATGEYCTDVLCELITITSDGSEVCGNEEDDDGDGLIDLFDPDCPCDLDAYQAQCPSHCEIVPDSFPDIKMKMKWQSEVLENSIFFTSDFQIYTNNDGNIEIITSQVADRYEMLTYYIDSVKLMTLSSLDGSVLQRKKIRNERIDEEFVVADPLKDGNKKFYFSQGNSLVTFDNSLNEIFISDTLEKNMRTPPSISDINHDGLAEILLNGIIYNSITGDILLVLPNGGCNFGTLGGFCLSNLVIADFIDSPGLEIAVGKKVYEINLENLTDSIGNSYISYDAPSEVTDGFTSVGDIDGDGKLDVIVITDKDRNGGGIYVWNPRNSSLIASAEAGEDGGVAFVGDIDGDCSPEIGMTFKNELRMYKYDGTTTLKRFWQTSTSDGSGRTGVTMFDFNQDGKQELVYRDETYLRIIEGISGKTLDSFYMVSPTGLEYPVIADIDNDGQAEILITGHENDVNKTRIYCFESASNPWAPARSVWNQYAYNPTQVNDDLTIPRYQQNAAQPLQGTENCPRETCNTPYNNFMVQATYRTQEGCYVWPELQRDLSITAESKCIGDSLEICFYTSSTDTTVLSQGVNINCYPPPWDEGNGVVIQSIDEIIVTKDTTCIMMAMLDIDSLLIVVNDDGGFYPNYFPITDIEECDYTNNEFVLHISYPSS